MSNKMVHATVRLGAGGEVTAMAKVKSVGKVLGVMVMLAVLCPVVAQAYVWQPDGAIQCTGITAPTSGEIVAPLSEVTCTVAAATDWDQRMIPPPSQWFPDTFNNEDAYTWASAGVGTFKDGDNTGQTVTWVAADQAMLQTTLGHECGHYTNLEHHGFGSACVMYRYSNNWRRDGHLCKDCRAMIRIHNN